MEIRTFWPAINEHEQTDPSAIIRLVLYLISPENEVVNIRIAVRRQGSVDVFKKLQIRYEPLKAHNDPHHS